jgi:putative flavoprotein involved in K+ transport
VLIALAIGGFRALQARYVFQPLLFRFIGHYVLTVDTPIGRKVRPKLLSHGAPLVRVKPKDLAAAGIDRVPRVIGVRNGLPLLEDERILDVANVVWCTGFRPDFSWIDLPVFGEDSNEPMHHRGIVADQPGLFFVGLFLYAMSSGSSVASAGMRSISSRPSPPGGSEPEPTAG